MKQSKLIAALMLFSFGLVARPFKDSGYKFYKEIKTSNSLTDSNYGKFKIDNDVIKNSYYTDLRVVIDEKQIPFLRRVKTNQIGKKGTTVPEVIFSNNKGKDSVVYVLELPKLPEGSEYTSLKVVTDSKFESNVNISLGNTPKDFSQTTNAFLYNYGKTGDADSILKFTPGKYKYARLEFFVKQSYSFPELEYVSSTQQADSREEIPLSSIKIQNDPDTDATVYSFENKGKPFQKILLKFEEQNFNRNYEIKFFNQKTKEFQQLTSGSLFNDGKEIIEQSIDLNQIIKSDWKLILNNGNDPALKLKSIVLIEPTEEIVFKISEDDKPNISKLRLYYGNEYALDPDFDLTWISMLEESTAITKFSTSEEKKNENFSYSILEPPVSSWIIRVLFFLGLALVAFPAYKVLDIYSKSKDEAKLS